MPIVRTALPIACLLLVRGSPGNAAAAQESYESVAVSVTVGMTLTNLHPLARQVGLQCGARGDDATALIVDLTAIERAAQSTDPNVLATAYSVFSQKLLSPAHYWRSETMPQFPLVNGGYSGAQQITLNVPSRLFVDPQTHQIVHDPYVMIGRSVKDAL